MMVGQMDDAWGRWMMVGHVDDAWERLLMVGPMDHGWIMIGQMDGDCADG